MADDGHVFGAVAGSQPRQILMEGHVEGPVKVVFDGPVASHGVGEAFGREGARGDVVKCNRGPYFPDSPP